MQKTYTRMHEVFFFLEINNELGSSD
jgi:hypothetical protein